MEPITMNIPVLALRGLTVFPHMNLTFDVERRVSIAALERAMEQVSERAGFYLQARAKSNFRPEADGKLQTEVMIFSNVYGLLGQTKGAAELLRKSGFTEKFI